MDDREHFRTRGWVLTRVLDAQAAETLRAWVDDVSSWPDEGGEWLHYREMTADGPIIDQDVIRVSHRDDVEDLRRKGRDLEVTVLARAVRAHVNHRVLVYGRRTVVFE